MLPLTAEQRDQLLTIYRKDPDPELRFRSHIILLLADKTADDNHAVSQLARHDALLHELDPFLSLAGEDLVLAQPWCSPSSAT